MITVHEIFARKNSENMKHRKFNLAMAAYIVVGIVLCALVGNALAKYFQSSSTADTVKAKEFYFSSDILNGLNYTLIPGANSVTFSIGNHEDALRISETDIDYSVSVTCVTDAPAPTITYGTSPQTLTANILTDHTVTLSNLQPGAEYIVTATGKGGYSKTLTGRFIVPPVENILYKYFQSTGEYVLLTVWSQGYQGNVSISCPTGVIPDNTDPVMKNSLIGNIINDTDSFSSNAYSSHTYRFFLNGSAVNVNSFTVTYANGTKTADYKKP